MMDEKGVIRPSSFIIHAVAPAYQGYCIGRLDGKVFLIKGAIPSETVEVTIDEEKKGYCLATATRIIERSPERTEPACEFFGICGGCQFQYISYPKQIQIKEEVLQDCLKRIAKIETALSESIVINNPWNYRFKGQFKVAQGKVGFYREKTREIVDIASCPLMLTEINESLEKSRSLLKSLDVKSGEIHISYGNGAVVLIKTADGHPAEKSWAQLATSFLKAGVKGVIIESPNKRLLKHGDCNATLKLCGLNYKISPMSFFQGHWDLNIKVVELIKKNLQPLTGKRILDLYAGAGNFSLPLASEAKEVIAVEDNKYAIEDGRTNLKVNDIKNCSFTLSSAEVFEGGGHTNILILDPPRLGLSNRVVEKVLKLEAERIVYISCNPANLARDLKKLIVKYDMESARLIDFFPQTYHIESLTFLRLR